MTLTVRNWFLILASVCAVLSLLLTVKELLSGRSLSVFEMPLVTSATLLFLWAVHPRISPEKARWFWISSTVASVLVLALLVGFPNDDPLQRILVTTAATCSLAGIAWKVTSP